MEKYDELIEKTAISVPIVCGIAAVELQNRQTVWGNKSQRYKETEQ